MSTAASKNGNGTASIGHRLVDLAFQALPAIGGAVGFVGFVALIGGAIDWIRFHSVGLPANQAVHAIPRGELVVSGAWALSIFVALGLLAVVIAFLGRRSGVGSAGIGFVLLAATEALVLAYMVDGAAALAILLAWLVAAGGLLALALRFGGLTIWDKVFARRLALSRVRKARRHHENTATATDEARARVQRLRNGQAPPELIADAEQDLATALRGQFRAEARWARVVDALGQPYD